MQPFFSLADAALLAWSVIESPCPYVCVSTVTIYLSIMAKVSGFFVFLYKIEWIGLALRMLNLEGHPNCMTVTKVMTILTMFFVLFISFFFLIWNQSRTTVDNGKIS